MNKFKDYCSEFERLASFDRWPDNAPARPIFLADAGFYYSGQNGLDEVTCFSCKCKISGWGPDSDPREKHTRLSPNCAFVQDGSGNKPMENPLNLKTLEDCLIALGHENELATLPAAGLLSMTSNMSDGHDDIYSVAERCNPTSAFFELMQSEVNRLETFHDWTLSHIQSMPQLASAGFFYTGESDRTQCAFCRGVLRNWQSTDVPMDEHRRHFPRCPLVLGKETSNIPASSSIPIRPISNMDTGIVSNQPKHPQYATELSRLQTYDDPHWKPLAQTPEMLAKAGFFYTGHSDNVKCFYCDGGLRNWEAMDDPWVEHAKWLPRCGFLRLNKGQDFIAGVQRSRHTFASPASGSLPQPQPLSFNSTGYVSHSDKLRRLSKARMDTEMVKTVVNMGYPQHIVRQVIEDRLASTGDDFPSSLALLEAIFEKEEEMNSDRDQSPVNGGHETAQPSAPMEDKDQKPPAVAKEDASSNPADEETSTKSKKSKRKRNKKKKNSAPLQGSPVPEELSPEEDQEVHEKPSPSKKSHRHTSKEYQSLKQENEEMKEQKICKVCMDNEVSIVFLPCGHLVCCPSCAPALRNCPICRQLIKGTVRVYLT